MEDKYFLIMAGILGLAVGLSGFYLMQQQQPETGYCQSIEQGIRDNQSFTGIISCRPPTDAELANRTNGTVEQNTELKCICRQSLNGREQIFEVRKSN